MRASWIARSLYLAAATTLYMATAAPHSAFAQQISAALAQKSPQAADIAATADQKGHVPVIVEFASPVPASDMRPDPAVISNVKSRVAAMQQEIISAHFGSVASPSQVQGFDRALQLMEISPMFAINVTRAELDALAADPRVVRVHLNGLSPPTLSDSVPLIQMTTPSGGAYGLGATGSGQAVAILDTGLQTNHEFLAGKVIREECFSNAGGGGTRATLCPNGTNRQSGTGASNALTAACVNGSSQICQHGTHVAGIAAGFNTNPSASEPPYGVAKDAKLIGIQVFTRFNDPADCGSAGAPCVLTWNSDQIAALDWLYQNALSPAPGVRLASANMSLGGGNVTTTCDGDSRKGSIDNLLNAGVATVIAAGNDSYRNAVGAPGCISTAVTVGSSTKSDGISSFSNMSSVVDLMAPGSSIQSSIPTVAGSTSTYSFFNGTSMATPHVAGVFAAIRSACPAVTVNQMVTALQNTGLTITDNRSSGTLSKPRVRVYQALQALGCVVPGGNLVATHDFDGDKKSDIVWRRSTGDIALWLMNGTAIKSYAAVDVIDPSWQIAGSGDFDGDGKNDIVWRHTSSGNVLVWLMNGYSLKNYGVIGSIGGDWQIVGTADFDGDGKKDLLWRNSVGDTAAWLLNGTAIKSYAAIGRLGTDWKVAGTGDFNGDGKGDILWRNTDGYNAIWLMNTYTISSYGSIGSVGVDWQIAETGDFDGDGKSDILWRSADGLNAIWLINGLGIKSYAPIGSVGTDWRIAGTGDFDGDGKSDVLWRYNAGDNALWLMNTYNIKTVSAIGSVSTDWQVQK